MNSSPYFIINKPCGSRKVLLLLWPSFTHFFIEGVGLEKYFNPSQHSNSIVLKTLKRAICGERETENQKKNLILQIIGHLRMTY